MKILEHDCMNCARKHLASASVSVGVHQLGHLCCALDHSGIEKINEQINNWWNENPVDVSDIIKGLNLDDGFNGFVRRGLSFRHTVQESLAVAVIIAVEISQGYNAEDYRTALLGHLSVAGNFSATLDIEFSNIIRGIRLTLFPDNKNMKDIDEKTIEDLFLLADECLLRFKKIKIVPRKLINYAGTIGRMIKPKLKEKNLKEKNLKTVTAKRSCGGCGRKK